MTPHIKTVSDNSTGIIARPPTLETHSEIPDSISNGSVIAAPKDSPTGGIVNTQGVITKSMLTRTYTDPSPFLMRACETLDGTTLKAFLRIWLCPFGIELLSNWRTALGWDKKKAGHHLTILCKEGWAYRLLPPPESLTSLNTNWTVVFATPLPLALRRKEAIPFKEIENSLIGVDFRDMLALEAFGW